MAEQSIVARKAPLTDEELERQAQDGQRARESAESTLSRVDAHLERMAVALERIAGGQKSPAWEDMVRERRDG